MELLVKVIDRYDPQPIPPRMLRIKFQNGQATTMDDLYALVKHEIGLDIWEKKQIDIIHAGKLLAESAEPLDAFNFSPATMLYAIIHQSIFKPEQQTRSLAASNFFIYCKSCAALRTGRLRVKCNQCQSGAILLKKEPDGWKDILPNYQIDVVCIENGCRNAKTDFYFKCIECADNGVDSIVSPLSQVHVNTMESMCVTCSVVESPIMSFDCDDVEACCQCLPCFIGYCTTSLELGGFRMLPPYGFTLTCPTPNCDGAIKDVHHYRLLGEQFYQRIQLLGTEASLKINASGLYCPNPACCTPYFIEGDEQRLLLCEKCYLTFCRNCKCSIDECLCGSVINSSSPEQAATRIGQHRMSMTTIRQIAKQCPSCRTDTERRSGCAHMTCTQCNFEWCWVCGEAWGEDCQDTHWFDR